MKKQKDNNWRYFFRIAVRIVIWAAIISLFLYLSLHSNIIQNTNNYTPAYHNYECDGKMLDDSCQNSQITRGGSVHLYQCQSGKEYVCQTVVEFP